MHARWLRRRAEQAEDARRISNEFERTRPVSDPQVSEGEPEVRLVERDEQPAAGARGALDRADGASEAGSGQLGGGKGIVASGQLREVAAGEPRGGGKPTEDVGVLKPS